MNHISVFLQPQEVSPTLLEIPENFDSFVLNMERTPLVIYPFLEWSMGQSVLGLANSALQLLPSSVWKF